ncbi:hypothetical protein SEA_PHRAPPUCCINO_172 [Mycobacterium phage Phrappuccino]|uniref:Uncharacterized protein n=1 Tax=Mycobacterium phage Phrappuccino TaxID=2591223 RepID=A0A514DE28_9CAUD|nr:hypothetical protein KHQ87_gp172 [Mycobacterium phage Phrappuccino]QDH91847.1 hypothetical protein SEA_PHRAPPUCCINO_172 [Mycobacterium phage Phrappuccino]QIQ63288.1 hypothetical protein SEA_SETTECANDELA_172 [Mycobacterium phage Settecandela]
MLMPYCNGRPLIQLIPVEVDDDADWVRNKAGRWHPEHGWVYHDEVPLP